MPRVASVALLLAVAAPCFAQETQQELAERIVREQEEVRRAAVEKVAGAPARAWDHADSTPFRPVGAEPAAAATPATAAAAAPKRAAGAFPWLTLALAALAVPATLLAFATLRRFLRDGR